MLDLAALRALARRHGFDGEDVSEDGSVTFDGCGNGNGTDCQVDPAILRGAKAFRAEVAQRWPGITVTADVCDEWVSLTVWNGAA